jgi:hypothetical protein
VLPGATADDLEHRSEVKEREGMQEDKETAIRVNAVLDKVRSSLGGADIRLKEVRDGIVVVQFRKAITDRSCHASKTLTAEEVVAEALEDQLKEAVKGFSKVVLVPE